MKKDIRKALARIAAIAETEPHTILALPDSVRKLEEIAALCRPFVPPAK